MEGVSGVDFKVVELSAQWSADRAFIRACDLPYPAFLDAGTDPENLGRYSFVVADPLAVVHAKNGKIIVTYPRSGEREEFAGNPFEALRGLLKRFEREGEPPFPLASGGAVGYLAYDLFPFVEALKRTAVDDVGMPDMFFGFYDGAYCFDNLTGRAFVSTAPFAGFEPGRLAEILTGVPPEAPVNPAPFPGGANLRPNQTPEAFRGAVSAAKEHIAAGDCYQVNLSQRFSVDYSGSPVDFYLTFRKVSPAPFGACLFPDGFALLSNSPERYLLIDGDYIETRPIKGTTPRGATEEEDRRYVRDLEESLKDSAEHLMIVDLERNDLGRVCRYTSVHVPEFRVIESYANVHHMVSTVAGRVDPSKDVVDCIVNSFPGGSITGAPKVRAIEIIDSLEPTARGAYCGSIGYIDFTGRVDLNIAIRTAIHTGRTLHFQVGGGIVADSDPEGEYQETLTKAQAFMKALTGVGRLWEP